MPWSGLVATTEFSPEAHYRAQGRRAPKERSAKPESQPAPPAAPEAPQEGAYPAGRFKTDLTQLQPFDGARETAPPSGGENDQQLLDFFGNFRVLLVAVRAGDINRAQSAADALEMNVLVERSAGRRPGVAAQMFEDFGALFDAAQSHDEEAAHYAAQELAIDFQNAAGPASQPQATRPDDGGAAYDTLTQYIGGGPGAG